MIPVPANDKTATLDLAHMLIEQCRGSVGVRTAYYRLLNLITETGRYDNSKSLINMMFRHLDRTAAHLFSPIELKFSVDFERPQPKFEMDRAQVVGKSLTRTWERNNIDTTFHRGVFESVKYGAAILKQWPQDEGEGQIPSYRHKLVMPWQFGVYQEYDNDLDNQEVMYEEIRMTLPQVWQRIWHLPNAKKLFEKIKSHSRQGESVNEPQNVFHQLFSSSQLNTETQSPLTSPGGVMQRIYDPNFSVMGPTIGAETVIMHELWVKDQDDYTTIQVIEPDILIAPLYKKANLLGIPKAYPYRLIQPNMTTNWFWGRTELFDLIEPQMLLSSWCDDMKRLFGLQVDKVLGFVGENTIDDERYAQFRNAGYVNLQPGSKIEDITPKMPPETLPILQFLIKEINVIGGFPDIMQGQGESGVRAGVHANTLLKTASPTLRDRSLLVERQCATAADLTLQVMEAKDDSRYWVKADKPLSDVEETSFLLSQLPDSWRVAVDSHSSSPIFSDDNMQLLFGLRRMGTITDDYLLDNVPIPNKDMAKLLKREADAKKAEQMKELMKDRPDLADSVLRKQFAGGKS